jgi:hypothetical protein
MPGSRRTPTPDGEPRRGRPHRIRPSRSEAKRQRLTIVIIDRPTAWIPAGELDAPHSGRVVEFVRDLVTDPATFIRQFNAASLDASGGLWAALAAGSQRLGRMARLARP